MLSYLNTNLILLLLVPACICAQGPVTLSGHVRDSSGNGLPYANVFFIQDSTTVSELLTDSTGQFSTTIAPGKYEVKVHAFGYAPAVMMVEATRDEQIAFTLRRATQELQEVIVTSRKQVVEFRVDRIVFNVENSIYNRGVDMIELLRQTPRIEVGDNEAISMVGKGAVRVMIDGRVLNLSEEDLKQRLRSLRSDNIARIEVIAIPPSRYSAQGNNGFINIVLKKNPNLGWSGNVNLAYLQRTYPSFTQNGTINYRAKSFEGSLTVNYDHSEFENLQNTLFRFANRSFLIDRHSLRKENTTSFNNVLKWKPAAGLELGSLLDYSFRKASNNDVETSTYFGENESSIDSSVYSPSRIEEKPKAFAWSAYIDYQPGKSGKKFSLTYNFYENTNDLNKLVQSEINSVTNKQQTLDFYGDNAYTIHSVMLDVELPSATLPVETGASYTAINNNSQLELYRKEDGQLILDPSVSNRFEYEENTTALYLSGTKVFNNRWSAKAGLRYEHTSLKGYSPTLSLTNNSTYGKLFPTVYLSYKPHQSHSFNLAYARRLDRPGFNDLNPFRYYSNVYTYVSGNAYLLPSFTHNVDLAYSYQGNFSVYLSYVNIKNGIDYLALVESDGTNRITPENHLYQSRYIANLSYTLQLHKRVSLYGSTTSWYATTRSLRKDLMIPSYNGYGGSFLVRGTVTLDKKSTAFAQLSYYQSLPSADGFNFKRGFGYCSANVRFQAAKGRLQFMISALDLFRQNYTTTRRDYSNYTTTNNFNALLQNYRVSVNYSFGNRQVNKVSKESKNTERYRGM